MAEVVPKVEGVHLPLDAVALQGPLPFEMPEEASDVTPLFFTSLLQKQGFLKMTDSVVSIESKIIGEDKGFTSVCVFAELTYSDGAGTNDPGRDLPKKLLVKISGGNMETKGLAKHILHKIIFPNEIRFFVENKSTNCLARWPRNFYACSRGTKHMMVMEHVDGICGDGMKTATKKQAVTIMIYLARLHGHFWGKRNEPDSPTTVQNFFAGSDWKSYPIILKKVFPKAFALMEQAFPESYHAIGEDFFKLLKSRWKSIASHFRSEPMTLCHGDIKLDNLIFQEGTEDDIVAVDWGVCGWGNPMGDVAYFFGRSVDTDDRRIWHDQLMNIYIDELHRVNPALKTQYTQQDCHRDLTIFALVPLLTTLGTLKGMEEKWKKREGCFASKNLSKNDKKKHYWMDRSFRRTTYLMSDLEVKERLLSEKKNPILPPIPFFCCWMNKKKKHSKRENTFE